MAFYHDVPGKRPVKKDHSQDKWEEEGTRYRGAARRFGPDAEDDGERRSFRSNNNYRDNRSYGQNRGGDNRRGYGDRRREDDRRDNRRDDFRPRRDDDRRDNRSFDRKPHGDRRFEEPRQERSYRDFEHRPAPVAAPVQEEIVHENLLSGRNPIREALKAGRDIEKLLVQKGELSGSAREIVQMAREQHIPVQEVEKSRLDDITPHHQGLLAFASAYQYSTVDAMLEEAAEKGEDPFLILLDGVTDPHNLGAIIRSAECVGAHGVIVPERRSVGLTPAAVKASAGAVVHMKVARVTNLNRTLEELKEKNVWTYALDMDGEDYEKVNFKGGVALVVGAEGEGVSRLTLEKCDQKVSLPMAGHIDSLNASVAAGIVMYRVLSSRRK
ncbi:MAG: 23S rRNA (guanosine(2251)-2'-O)-methyltransferase RlmB [Clostridia bacterium]|nr:23S rRNA (guanosine(2251)-2'-O)-methyltransferase RlmB [Clostridia bacterium]